MDSKRILCIVYLRVPNPVAGCPRCLGLLIGQEDNEGYMGCRRLQWITTYPPWSNNSSFLETLNQLWQTDILHRRTHFFVRLSGEANDLTLPSMQYEPCIVQITNKEPTKMLPSCSAPAILIGPCADKDSLDKELLPQRHHELEGRGARVPTDLLATPPAFKGHGRLANHSHLTCKPKEALAQSGIT